MRLILASASPRRAELLRAAGFEFEVVVADVDESLRDGESSPAYVRRLAAEKSYAASGLLVARFGAASRAAGGGGISAVVRENPAVTIGAEAAIILGADTTVVIDGEILGKPRNDDEVAAMLRKLSGKRHQVLTGLSVRRGESEVGSVETTDVVFRTVSADEVDWYVASGEGRDKAGAYAIQGRAARFIPRIDGSYSNVVGLPIAAVTELLRTLVASQR